MGLPWHSSELLHLPRQGVQAQSLVRELRSHMSHGQKNQNINNRSNTITNSIEKKKNDPHIKKKTFKQGKLNEKCSEISSFQTLRKICRAREKVIKASVLTILPT